MLKRFQSQAAMNTWHSFVAQRKQFSIGRKIVANLQSAKIAPLGKW